METSVFILNLGYSLTFIALAIREVLWLRTTLTAAQISLFTYHFFFANNQSAAFWTAIFVIVNTINIIKIILERRPKIIPKELQDLYKGIFNNLTTREFIYFWNMGNIKSVKDKFLIHSGEHQNNLLLILYGKISNSVLMPAAFLSNALYQEISLFYRSAQNLKKINHRQCSIHFLFLPMD